MRSTLTRCLAAHRVTVFVGCLACRPGTAPAAADVAPRAPLTETLDHVFQVGDLDLFMHCEGVGEPPVVFDSGLGAGASLWQRVQADVALQTRACAYDRAGRGRSGPAPFPHSLQQMAEELHDLLERAAQAGPFVLVGHSMGAGPVRWFEIQHSELVVGMVLVDPATASGIEAASRAAPVEKLAEFDRQLRAVEGIDRESYLKGFSSLRESGQTLGERPLMVLTAGQPEATLASRQALGAELDALSSDLVRVVAEKSGHDVVTDEPTLVSHSVLSVVAAVRGGQPVKAVWAAQVRASEDE
jgi:pimeloyl-ACP methyl ester carboxylesterase